MNKKKNLWILLAVVVIVIVIIVIAANSMNKTENKTNAPREAASSGEVFDESEEGAVKANPALEDAVTVVPGANLVTKDDRVITTKGDEVKNDVQPMAPDAPQQTGPVDKEVLSNEVIQLSISSTEFDPSESIDKRGKAATLFEPSEFTVKKGEAVTLAISSTDGHTHIFMFDDDSLKAIAVGIGPDETRAISFNAPDKSGEYTFRCDVSGHVRRGEVGTMIVK